MSGTARKSRKKAKPVALHPVSPLPSMLVRLHLLRRGTTATDFGLDAIFVATLVGRARRKKN